MLRHARATKIVCVVCSAIPRISSGSEIATTVSHRELSQSIMGLASGSARAAVARSRRRSAPCARRPSSRGGERPVHPSVTMLGHGPARLHPGKEDRMASEIYQVPETTAAIDEQASMATGYGWLAFAWITLVTVGTFTIVEGVVALTKETYYDPGAVYLIFDLTAWGWIMIALGVLQLIAAV